MARRKAASPPQGEIFRVKARRIGKLIVADMGVININPANVTKTSEEGNNDTGALDKDIITIVHAEFEVN